MHFNGSRISLLALSLVAAALPVRAQLLNAAYEAQLVTWIDHGPLSFTNDFTKIAGDGQTSFDFHAAADAKGPTVTLLDITPFDSADGRYDLPSEIIGGATPIGWTSSTSWNIPTNPLDRSAFVFNLSDDVVQRENQTDFAGQFQTFDNPLFGPTFGLGDLVTGYDLEHGTAFHASYGGTSPLTPNVLGQVGVTDLFKINRLEVYSVAAIPEPAACAALIAGLLGAVVLFRRRPQVSAAMQS